MAIHKPSDLDVTATGLGAGMSGVTGEGLGATARVPSLEAVDAADRTPVDVEDESSPLEASVDIVVEPSQLSGLSQRVSGVREFDTGEREETPLPSARSEEEEELYLHPPIQPPRGARLVATGAIMLATFGAGLAISTFFASRSTAHTLIAAASTPIAVATPSVVATPAAVATGADGFTTPIQSATATATPEATPEPAATAKAPAAKAKTAVAKKSPAAKATKSAKPAASKKNSAELLSWEADPHAGGPDSRSVHVLSGKKTLLVNHAVAVTRANGKTFVGTLVDVKNGIVDIKTGKTHVKIAEGDLRDIANY